MSTTTNLGITHIEESQSQKEVTINAAFDKLDDLGLGAISFTLDGGGSEIADNTSFYTEVPYGMTLTGWSINADVSGDISIDVWKDVRANGQPTDADSITNGNEIEMTGAIHAHDDDLGNWTTVACAAGDILKWSVDSCTTITKINVVQYFTRTVA